MTSETQSARDDLAFLRSLVDEDWRPGTWMFGALYLLVGVALAAHVLVSWGTDAGYLPLRGASLKATYVGIYVVASFVWIGIYGHVRRASQRGGAPPASVKVRAGAVVLVSAFLGHLVMMIVFFIVAVRQRNEVFLELAPLVLFTLQSVVWFVIHAMRRQRWHGVLAWGWLVAVLGLAPLVGTSAFNLGIAVTALALMIVPGAYMMHVASKD